MCRFGLTNPKVGPVQAKKLHKVCTVNWIQHSVQSQSLSICRNWPVGIWEHLTSRANCQLPNSSSIPPLSLALSTSSAAVCCMLYAPWGRGLYSQMQALSISCLCPYFSGSHKLSGCLSIVELGSCTLRGPLTAPPLSVFRIQTAAMLELLAMLMDPFISHWNT